MGREGVFVTPPLLVGYLQSSARIVFESEEQMRIRETPNLHSLLRLGSCLVTSLEPEGGFQ